MFRDTVETPTLDFWMSSKTQSSPKTSDVWRNFSTRRPLANKMIITIKRRKKDVIAYSPKTWGLQRGRMSKQGPAVKQHRGGWRRSRRAAEKTEAEEERGAYLAEELRLLSWGLQNFCWSTFCCTHSNRHFSIVPSLLCHFEFWAGRKSVQASCKTRASTKSLSYSWILFFRWQRKTINNRALVACHRTELITAAKSKIHLINYTLN